MIEVYSSSPAFGTLGQVRPNHGGGLLRGMENVSATTLIDWLPDERAYLDRPWYSGSSSRTSWRTNGSATT